jgi:5,5'-dehydrodivanillate O-demethylase oxygenase subunit
MSGMSEKARLLTETSSGSQMGTLLRRFWHPLALSVNVASGKAKAVRLLGEDLTLYRGNSGRPYLVAGRCAHRLTLLHTGWVEGERIRCMYHGWQYDGDGQCVDRPAEKRGGEARIQIKSYPVHEYCGIIFAYLGEGEPPAFDLPRKQSFEKPGMLLFSRKEIWPCNWLQHVENSLDSVHVSFAHQMGRVGAFGEAITTDIPELSYRETEAGICQVAVRAKSQVRISDWTFPYCNHVSLPGLSPRTPGSKYPTGWSLSTMSTPCGSPYLRAPLPIRKGIGGLRTTSPNAPLITPPNITTIYSPASIQRTRSYA